MSTKTITNEAMLECLCTAVRKTLDRKRRLGQYAVVWDDGQIKELRFDGTDPNRNASNGTSESSYSSNDSN